MADPGLANTGTLSVVPPHILEERLAKQQQAKAAALAPPEPSVPELAGYVRTQFEIFRNHRNTASGWSNRLLEALRTSMVAAELGFTH